MPKDSSGNHRIPFDVRKMDKYYEDMMDDVYMDHHVYPTNLTPSNETPSQRAMNMEYESTGRGLSSQHSARAESFRKSKRVYYPQNDCPNGIPNDQTQSQQISDNRIGCSFAFLMIAIAIVVIIIISLWT